VFWVRVGVGAEVFAFQFCPSGAATLGSTGRDLSMTNCYFSFL
jgi:hypothetical protein